MWKGHSILAHVVLGSVFLLLIDTREVGAYSMPRGRYYPTEEEALVALKANCVNGARTFNDGCNNCGCPGPNDNQDKPTFCTLMLCYRLDPPQEETVDIA